jgi:phytoene dehydrogenase-like protein
MEKTIIIIGAGLAGLSTGCFAQRNGYKTQIFELQANPGGVCTSWKRKGYTFDYAVHNVFGTTANSVNNQLWQELGALVGLKTHSFKEFVQVEENGKVFTVHTNLDELQQHMEQLAPQDKKLIEEFIKAARKFSGYDLFAGLSGGIGTKLKMLPIVGYLKKYSQVTLKEYADQFGDPFMRKAFATIQYDIPEVPTVIALIFLATLNQCDGGWPIGGSAALAKNIEKRYLSLGGQISYNSMVKKIIVKDNKAIGVELKNGSQHLADTVISAADGYSIIFNMLDGKYLDDSIRAYYSAYPKTQPFGLEIWYGINRNLSQEPHALVLFLKDPITIEDKPLDRIDVEIFNFDQTLVLPNKAIIKVVFNSNYDYWHRLSEQPENYRNEKQKLADQVAQCLEFRFPGIASQIETSDVVTPVSVEHWTGAYRGCQAWGLPKNIVIRLEKMVLAKLCQGSIISIWLVNGLAALLA